MFTTIANLFNIRTRAQKEQAYWERMAKLQRESEARFWSGVDTTQRLGYRTEFDLDTRTETRYYTNGTVTQESFS